jgi:DNA cross-link repair 1C protein
MRNADYASWKGFSIKGLFGSNCSGNVFRFDTEMLHVANALTSSHAGSQQTVSSISLEEPLPLLSSPIQGSDGGRLGNDQLEKSHSVSGPGSSDASSSVVVPTASTKEQISTQIGSGDSDCAAEEIAPRKRKLDSMAGFHLGSDFSHNGCHEDSQASVLSAHAFEARTTAFQTMVDNMRENAGGPIGLISTTDNHSELDVELGEHRGAP